MVMGVGVGVEEEEQGSFSVKIEYFAKNFNQLIH